MTGIRADHIVIYDNSARRQAAAGGRPTHPTRVASYEDDELVTGEG
jgi:hypothetical protein